MRPLEFPLYHVHLPKLAESGLTTVAERDEWRRPTLSGTPETKDALSDLLALEET